MDLIKQGLKECDAAPIDYDVFVDGMFAFCLGVYIMFTKHHPDKEQINRKKAIDGFVKGVYERVKSKHSEQEVREHVEHMGKELNESRSK